MPTADADLRGQLLDSRYLVEECIGRGGMGVVWRVRHAQTRQLFALKTIRGKVSQGKRVIRRLLHEARATAAVKSRHVVRVVDVDPDYVHAGAHLPYIVMELLEGENLSQFLERTGTIGTAELVWIMRQVSQALASAHARGIVHRDLKPSNVFLAREDDGQVVAKVCDFGIAKLQGAAIADLAETGTLSTATGEILGTPRYMAPEQLRRAANEGPATDQWAFALIAFRALTGRNYFESATNVAELVLAIVHEALPVPSALSARFPTSLDAWFAHSCSRDPAARFSSIQEQQTELEKCLGDVSPLAIQAGNLRPHSAVGERQVTSSADEPRSKPLRAPAVNGQTQPVRPLLFYACLGGAVVFALVGARLMTRHLSVDRLGRSSDGALRKSADDRTIRPLPRVDSHGSHLPSLAPPSTNPSPSTATSPSTRFADTMAKPPTTSSHRIISRRRIATLLPKGSPCTRSTQCESGMCAAEVCQ